MKKVLFAFLFFIGYSVFCIAQPSIEWQSSLGGPENEIAHSIQQTADGGFIIAGEASSVDGDVKGNHGLKDYWIVKQSGTGNVEWAKCYGGIKNDIAHCIQQTIDGGYIVAGESESNGGDVSGSHGGKDFWVIKLNAVGDIQWQKCYGGGKDDVAYFIRQTTDGGYIVAGVTESVGGDVTGNHGGKDYWIVKVNGLGAIEWKKCYGGTALDYAYSIQQTSDGGYIVAGESASNNGDVKGNHGSYDFWIVKINSIGMIEWQKCYGGTNYDAAFSIQQTPDGSYIIAGESDSNDGNVTGNHGENNFDYWIVKISTTGVIQWEKCYGGSGFDFAFSIQQTSDGGYVVAGESESNNGDVSGNHGNIDFWVLKLNNTGKLAWQKCYGGTGVDVAQAIQITSDGGFLVGGVTRSNDGDVSGHYGSGDYWVVKLSATK